MAQLVLQQGYGAVGKGSEPNIYFFYFIITILKFDDFFSSTIKIFIFRPFSVGVLWNKVLKFVFFPN